MTAPTRPLTIRYEIPGISAHGQLLDEIVVRPTAVSDGIGFVIDPSIKVAQRTLEIVARATRRIARTLGVRARTLTVRCIPRGARHVPTGHDCSPQGDAILDLTLEKGWTFQLWLALLRARDLLSGSFPSMHATARVPWIEVLWTISLEGRLSARGVARPAPPKTAVLARSAEDRARDELVNALIWAGKQRGLSLSRNDAGRIAHLVWGKNVSLFELVALGEKFGFRCEGPLASIPLPESWPRNLSDVMNLRAAGDRNASAIA